MSASREPVQYRTLARAADVEIEAKRSRFLGRARRVATEEQARAVIEQTRKEYWDAGHHCYGFVVDGPSALGRSSDDREPSGTAGVPILQAITGRELSDTVVVVTRYWGGTKLGTGGLVRAYGDAASAALDAARVVVREQAWLTQLTVGIADAGRIEHAVREAGYVVDEVAYADQAVITALVADDRQAEFAELADVLSRGEGVICLGESRWVDRQV